MTYHEQIRRIFQVAPLGATALVVYATLKSSVVLASDAEAIGWHPGHFGWYDVMFFGATAVTVGSSRLRPSRGFWTLVVALFAATSISYAANDIALFSAPGFDGFVILARLMAGIVLGYVIQRAAQPEGMEAFVGLLVALLAASSLFVFDLMRETGFVRFFAAGMTVASFSQILAVAALIGYYRHKRMLLVASLVFLLFTFSRTSTLALLLVVGVGWLRNTGAHRPLLRRALPWATAAVILFLVLARSPVFERTIEGVINPVQIQTLHDRDIIWAHGIALIVNEQVGPFGVGFGRTPQLLEPLGAIGESDDFVPSFHTLGLELALGLGLLAIVFLLPLAIRVIQAWRNRAQLTFAIYGVFLITQFADFTLYRPKELVLWGFVLGIAEADLAMRRGKEIADGVANKARAAVRAS